MSGLFAKLRSPLMPIVAGLALLSVWSDLVGHGSGLISSADAVRSIGNARAFFLVGLTLITALHFIAPRLLKGIDTQATVAVAVLSTTATALFSLPYLAYPMRPDVICGLGLFFIGVGYGWFVVRLLCQIAYEENYATAAYVLVVSLLAKTVATGLLSTYMLAAIQIAVAVAAPALIFASTRMTQAHINASPETLDLMELPKVCGSDRRVLLTLLISLPVLRALARSLSNMGYWGSSYEAIDLLNGLGIVIVGTLIVLVTRWALVREEGSNLAVRFCHHFSSSWEGSSSSN